MLPALGEPFFSEKKASGKENPRMLKKSWRPEFESAK